MVVRKWRQRADIDVAQSKRIAGAQRSNSDSNLMRFVQKSRVRLNWRIVPHPQLARMKVAQHRRQSTHVVRVSVRQYDRIEMTNAPRPQRRRYDFFADVELLRRLSWSAAESASVDQQRFSVRRHKQN